MVTIKKKPNKLTPTERLEDNFDLAVSYHLNILRRAYFCLRSENEVIQADVLDKMKQAAVSMMAPQTQGRPSFTGERSTLDSSIRFIEKYVESRGLGVSYQGAAAKSTEECHAQYQTLRWKAKLTGREPLDVSVDLHHVNSRMIQDYATRVDMLDDVEDPLIIGIMTHGIPFAATYYGGVTLRDNNPSFAFVKRSRWDRGLHVYSVEEQKIREALAEQRRVIVVDDIIHSFQSFFDTYDYFGKPQNMSFSALVYYAPLPIELDIIERTHLSKMFNGERPAVDEGLKVSFRCIAQYRCGIDRSERSIHVLPPLF
jgi:hypoxanthine-guanine phosphoribosyltransferase